MTERVNRQLVLVSRPEADVQDENFELSEKPLRKLKVGEVLVKNLWLSFDPTQRGWLNDVPSYIPPVQIGEVMRASGVGQVIESNNPDFNVSDRVEGLLGWQDYLISRGNGSSPLNKLTQGVPLTYHLHLLGITGMTAYFGMLRLGEPQAGQTVVVSAAAGATGSVAGQIAKLKGCRVIGIAGGPKKCQWIKSECGFDEAIDYKNENVAQRLDELCNNAIDIYFDNVGGPILDDVLLNMKEGGRVVLCGGISSGYGLDLPPGPKHYMQLVIRRCRMEGFIVLDYIKEFPHAGIELMQWVAAGDIKVREDIQEGLEYAPATLRRLFEGKNFGKQLLKVADPE